MGSLLRLALAAATGASIGGLQNMGRRIVLMAAVAIVVALVGAGAIGSLAAAGWYALLPEVGPAWAALVIGLALAFVAAVIWAIAERRHRRLPPPTTGLLDALPLAAAPLAELDLRGTLQRHAGTVLLAAFVAGMLLNRRR